MSNDKAFVIYAAAIFLGISSLITFVLFTQASHIPAPVYILEHVGLGLGIRAYYKAFDGESGYYAVARGVRNYLGLGEERLPAGAAPQH